MDVFLILRGKPDENLKKRPRHVDFHDVDIKGLTLLEPYFRLLHVFPKFHWSRKSIMCLDYLADSQQYIVLPCLLDKQSLA